MTRLLPVAIGVSVILAFLATVGFLVWKAREVPEEFAVENPYVADIVSKTVATGAMVPRTEVAIKSRVSGVVDSLAVEPGQHVEAGQLIAVIRIIPDVQALSSAESAVESARIAKARARDDLMRDEELYASRAISIAELEASRSTYALAEEDHRSAQRTLRIVREGHAGGSAGVSTHITSTVPGTVLSVDIKLGESVTETNTFSEGTTIATVADMTDMIFEGKVDESEVGKIAEGMPLEVKVGALGDKKLDGVLEYISPKGVLEEGAVLFEIEAAVQIPEGTFVRAGSSANAAIVLDQRRQALAIDEGWLRFEAGQAYVEVETRPQVFERRDVRVGLSDGLKIEVLEGLTADDRVKAGTKSDKGGGGSGGGRGRRVR